MKIRRILFLSLGLERVYPAQERKRSKNSTENLIEPDRARVCRRNIMALAAVVVVANAAGTNPRYLNIFGVEPSDDWGLLVLGAAVILVHLYWYVLRYYHLRDDGRVEAILFNKNDRTENIKIKRNDLTLVRRGADLFSNWVAFVLTCLSWLSIFLWVVSESPF